MILGSYASFENLYGRKSTVDELISHLKYFSRESVIYYCSVVGLILKLWQREAVIKQHYDTLLRSVFSPALALMYSLRAVSDDPQIVFHRRQLLSIIKLALVHCSDDGVDVLLAQPGRLGTIFLMANDHLHFGLHIQTTNKTSLTEDNIMRVLAEFIPVAEHADPRVEVRMIRSHLMVTRHTQNCILDVDFVDVAVEFERATGISLDDYEALVLGLYARCGSVDLTALQQNAWLAAIRNENFYTSAISHEIIERFTSELSISPTEAAKRIQSRDAGTNDFTVFRDKPLILEKYGMLPTDVLFAISKFESGPYWKVSSTSKQMGDKLRRFWGRVFESYVNELFADAAQRSGATFIPDPRRVDNNNIQVCDALWIEDDTLVILEYKSSMFTAEAKYRGDHLRLLDEIKSKLVRDEIEGKKKGVQQLGEAVAQLCSDSDARVVKDLDMTKVRHVYPMLVTLDSIGDVPLISTLLNIYFDKWVDRKQFKGPSVSSVFCAGIESLEVVLPFSDILPLSGFLQHWIDSDSVLARPLLDCLPDGLPARRNEILYSELQTLNARILRQLFPNETSASASDE